MSTITTEDTILVGFNAAHGEEAAFIVVGRKSPGALLPTIINTICGQEAMDIYNRLVTKKEKTDASKS